MKQSCFVQKRLLLDNLCHPKHWFRIGLERLHNVPLTVLTALKHKARKSKVSDERAKGNRVGGREMRGQSCSIAGVRRWGLTEKDAPLWEVELFKCLSGGNNMGWPCATVWEVKYDTEKQHLLSDSPLRLLPHLNTRCYQVGNRRMQFKKKKERQILLVGLFRDGWQCNCIYFTISHYILTLLCDHRRWYTKLPAKGKTVQRNAINFLLQTPLQNEIRFRYRDGISTV